MDRTRADIESDVDRLLADLPERRGGREHLLAYHLAAYGHAVDVRCPDCNGVLTVTMHESAATVACSRGLCTGAFRGL